MSSPETAATARSSEPAAAGWTGGGHVVGAYAASPAHRVWDPEAEAAYLDALAALPDVAAFELPWMGSLHPHDDEWLLRHLPDRVDVVFTDIPFVMPVLGSDPDFGLASALGVGRAQALSAAARLRDDVRRLNDQRGRTVVRVVELHSAPRRDVSDANRFAEALAEVAGWDWDGAQLVVEHCDAQRPGRSAEKGFLALDEEIRAIRASGSDVGLSMNWGRSAIELRDGDLVRDQVAQARASGLLRGIMLSGASDRAGAFGPAWTDAHHPFVRSEMHPDGDPGSLLSVERARDALTAAGTEVWTGVKVGWAGHGEVSARVRMIDDALDVLRARGSIAAPEGGVR